MDAIARALRGEPGRSFDSIEAFFAEHQRRVAGFERPIDRAIAGGALADRLGYAFASGYAAAIQALCPALGAGDLASLAATEEGGAHPKAIRTQLRPAPGGGFLLEGHKKWVTLAGAQLLVLARLGEDEQGRAVLRVVRLPRDRQGIRTVPLSAMPFVPEIPHAEIVFEGVAVFEDELLPGDGWTAWVKPFRTVEDIHVHAAVLAHLLTLGVRSSWPRALLEQLSATLVCFRALSLEDPSSRTVHIALAGAMAQARAAIAQIEPLWDAQPADVRERWRRDRPLLEVAQKARAARIDKAWAD
ncbi:MAG: acyl-CoA dehydrogenase family protein [Myxococcaceae bacterium]|nr:acyl-CoA dehydrogenase family protein [Myxococcaceae bacterium]